METNSYGPFENYEDMLASLRAYESIRASGAVNMFELGMFWDRNELRFIMDLYKQGATSVLLTA